MAERITRQKIKDAERKRNNDIQVKNEQVRKRCIQAVINRLTTAYNMTPDKFNGKDKFVISMPMEDAVGFKNYGKCIFLPRPPHVIDNYCGLTGSMSYANPFSDISTIRKEVEKYWNNRGLKVSDFQYKKVPLHRDLSGSGYDDQSYKWKGKGYWYERRYRKEYCIIDLKQLFFTIEPID